MADDTIMCGTPTAPDAGVEELAGEVAARLGRADGRAEIVPILAQAFSALLTEKAGAERRKALADGMVHGLRRQIGSLTARAEQAEAELTALRETVKGLPEKWRDIASLAIEEPEASRHEWRRGRNMGHLECADELDRALSSSTAREGE